MDKSTTMREEALLEALHLLFQQQYDALVVCVEKLKSLPLERDVLLVEVYQLEFAIECLEHGLSILLGSPLSSEITCVTNDATDKIFDILVDAKRIVRLYRASLTDDGPLWVRQFESVSNGENSMYQMKNMVTLLRKHKITHD